MSEYNADSAKASFSTDALATDTSEADTAKIESHKIEAIAQDVAQEMQAQEWSRVSPLAIIYFFAKTLYFLVNSVLIYSLPALAVGFQNLKENPVIAIVAVAVLLTVVLVISVVKYWFYFYKFGDARVEIRQGIFKKSHLDLPFKKIQNVKIVQPIYYRFNHYSFIELDTAGSAQQEAKIVALPLELAEKFKRLILQIKDLSHDIKNATGEGSTANANTQNAYEQEVLLNERSLKDLVIHGISNNRVWIILGFLAPFYGTIAENLTNILDSMGFDIVAYLDYQSQSIGLFILHVLSLVMLIMLFIVSFSVVGSIFIFYKYRLSRHGDRYIRRSGLLTKQEVSMRLSRIQIAVQQQDWLDIIIKRTNLRFEQNVSLPGAAGGQAGSINNASKLIVPSVTPVESIELIQDAFKVKQFTDINFAAISRRFVVRTCAFPVFPLIAIMTGIAIAADFSLTGWVVVCVLSIILFALTWLRWWRWGYYFDEDFVYIRKGLFGVNYYVFPIGKTQQVKYKQSIFMRPRKLADIQYVLASGAHKVPLIPEKLAREKADEALFIVAKFKPSWM
jgi:putative membrane protein